MATIDELNEAYSDLLDAARRVHRLTGARVHIGAHNLQQSDFFAARFVASDFSNENGDPEYGHVKGHEKAYLARRIYRGDGVIFETFMSTAPRPDIATP